MQGNRTRTHGTYLSIVAAIVWMMALALPSQAQTFTVLHTFTGGQDGAAPGGLTLDEAGNLYGVTEHGAINYYECYAGCGTTFKLTHKGASWLLSTLYAFTGNGDGGQPWEPVSFGPDGALYGVTGEIENNQGTVFRLQPPVATCRSSACPWTETVLFSTPGGFTGIDPLAPLIFDSAGNIYGAMEGGGRDHQGYAYELVKSDGWRQQVLHQFTGEQEGGTPWTNLIFDSQGNLYGTNTSGGANGYGTVFQLSPQRGWQGTALYNFQNLSDGSSPLGNFIQDSAGNFYGSCQSGGLGTGTVWELSPGNGGWTFTTLYQFIDRGTPRGVTMDQSGNLYGTTFRGGANGVGNVFKLSPGNGGWTYTSLYDFTGGSDGAYPIGRVVIDPQGNLYGTTFEGGQTGGNVCSTYGCGTVWEIMP